MKLAKYIGSAVRIVYIDRHNRITERIIDIRSIHGDRIKAYCRMSGAPRIFSMKNVLAFEAVNRCVI
jgi:predicted DNA-binding transcriptional regulator YafY